MIEIKEEFDARYKFPKMDDIFNYRSFLVEGWDKKHKKWQKVYYLGEYGLWVIAGTQVTCDVSKWHYL